MPYNPGLCVHVFFDNKSIGWGKRWAEFIKFGLEKAAFLVPIVTPAFFQNDACRDEYLKFMEVEKTSGRRDMILPVYYVRCRELLNENNTDPIVDDIASRQYRDWRDLRHRPQNSPEILQKFAQLALEISDSYFEINNNLLQSPSIKQQNLQKANESRNRLNELFARPITFDNVVAYSVELFPDLPVSRAWTDQIIKDINKDRYKTIKDIDMEVKYAHEKVWEYARERPDLFRNSTDYITKSLIFTDEEFRSAHPISPITHDVATQAGITRFFLRK
mgnify:CR=1 FL=1